MVGTGTGHQRYHPQHVGTSAKWAFCRARSEWVPIRAERIFLVRRPDCPHGHLRRAGLPAGQRSLRWRLRLSRQASRSLGGFARHCNRRRRPSKTPAYTEQQISDARNRVCAAVDTTHKGVALQSGANKQDSVSSDPALAEGQAANARLAIVSGSWYLRDHLDPATPQPLADTVRHLSAVMLDIGANYLAGERDADQAQFALLSDGDSTFARALGLCK